MINRLITELVSYGNRAGLVADEDQVYVTNQLLELFDVIEYEPAEVHEKRELVEILEDLLDYAWEQGILKENTVTMRDLYDTKIMGKLTPAPSVVRRQFADLYSMDPKLATNFYYKFSQATNYIRKDRIAKDEKWVTETEYGRIDITINLSKPEKIPEKSQRLARRKNPGIRAACSVWKMRDMPAIIPTPPDRITVLFPSSWMGKTIFYSIPLMCITMNTVSYLTGITSP